MDIIEGIINTLNQIPVKGEEDLSRMLGCIQALHRLKDIKSGINQAVKEENENGKN